MVLTAPYECGPHALFSSEVCGICKFKEWSSSGSSVHWGETSLHQKRHFAAVPKTHVHECPLLHYYYYNTHIKIN